MNKFLRLLPVLGLLLLLTACGSGANSIDKEAMAHYVPMTENLISAFKDRDTETLIAASDEKLAAYFANPENLKTTYETLDQDGELKGFAKVKGYSHKNDVTEATNISILQNVRFENRTRTFSLTYNENDELIGFYAK